jgi:dTDP-4-amino-4,6-dideoxygalactose transaminase
MNVPLFRPQVEMEACHGAIEQAMARVIRSGVYVNGPETERFEAALAAWFGSPYAVALSSGTTALEWMLRADGIGPGTTVVLTAHTFVAVLEAILAVGAEPQFCDIDPVTWQMPRVDADGSVVLVSHLYGSVSAAVDSSGARVYEDASQCVGARLDGRLVGTLTRAAGVSLYPTKNLSAMGDAGALLTGDADLAARMRALRNHGQTAHQVHSLRGTTARIDELQAAILYEKLLRLDGFIEARRQAWRFYQDALEDFVELPRDVAGSESAPNLGVIRVRNRDELRRTLDAEGISTGVHYPTPLHEMPAYRDAPWANVPLPHTEQLSREILSLPLWVGISPEQQERVVAAVRKHARR